MKNQRKYTLAKNLSKKYAKMANQAYEAKGCFDSNYRLYSRISGICFRILNRNNWDNCI